MHDKLIEQMDPETDRRVDIKGEYKGKIKSHNISTIRGMF